MKANHKATVAAMVIAAGLSLITTRYAMADYSVPDMVRGSEYVALLDCTKVDASVSPPQVHCKVKENFKGKLPGKVIIGVLPDDAGGTDVGKPWKANTRYLTFITQMDKETKIVFTFQNLQGKIAVGGGKKQANLKELVKAVINVDKVKDKAQRTKLIRQYLASKSSDVQRWAFKEIQIRSSNYDVGKLKDDVAKGLKDGDEAVRERAVLALTRIYDAESRYGISRDLKLFDKYIEMMNDKSEKVRAAAHQQLASHSRKQIPFDPAAGKKERKEQIKEWKDWLKSQQEDESIFGGGSGEDVPSP